MRRWNVRDGLDFCHFQYPQVGLPLVEPVKRIVIGTEILRHSELPSNGTVEHPTKCGPIDRSRMDAKANDPACVLIHDHQDPVGPQSSRFAPEQIHAPEAVFHVAQERQPGGAVGVLYRPVVTGENPANYVFVDLDVDRQGYLFVRFADSPSWDYVASFRSPNGRGLRWVLSDRASDGGSVRTARGAFACTWLCEGLGVSRVSERLRNGEDE